MSDSTSSSTPLTSLAQPAERIVGAGRRQSLVQLTRDEALHRAVDLLHAPLRAAVQEHADREGEAQRRDQAQQQGALHGVDDPGELIIGAGNDQGRSVGQRLRQRPHGLPVAAGRAGRVDRHELRGAVQGEPGRQRRDVAGDAAAGRRRTMRRTSPAAD